MATPANTSTEIRLAKIRQELETNNYGGSAYTANQTSLYHANIGTYGTINTGNATADRPDGSAPHTMSEFYNYDHDLSTSVHGTTLTRGSRGGYGFAQSGYWDGVIGSMGDDTLTLNSRARTIFRLYNHASSTGATTGHMILQIDDDAGTTTSNAGWTTMKIWNGQTNDSGTADHTFNRSSATYSETGGSGYASMTWTWSVSLGTGNYVFSYYWGSSNGDNNFVRFD